MVSLKQTVSGIVMLLLLRWLTICAPFVYTAQQNSANTHLFQYEEGSEEGCSNPLAANEERAEEGLDALSDYLYQYSIEAHHFITIDVYYKGHKENLHLNFHPDYFSPPPKV